MPLPCQSAITKQKNDARAFQQNGVAEVDAHRAAFVLDLAWSPRAASSGKTPKRRAFPTGVLEKSGTSKQLSSNPLRRHPKQEIPQP